jgi:YidC/Oxa1 family membrane protein insertase
MSLSRLIACVVCWISFSAHADVELSTQSLELRFGEQGELLTATACFPGCDAPRTLRQDFSGSDAFFVFEADENGRPQLERIQQVGATRLRYHFPGHDRELIWTIPDTGWKLTLETRGIGSLQFHSGASFRPPSAAGFGRALERVRYLWFSPSDIEAIELGELEAGTFSAADWSGFRNRFWAVMLRAGDVVDVTPSTGASRQDASLSVDFSGNGPQKLEIYAGPVEPAALRSADQGLAEMMYSALWFWLRWICMFLFMLLNWIHTVIPAWGLSIMALSLAVNLLMRPLSKMADRLQDQVQTIEARLAPKLKEIRAGFKGEQQAEKILAMYRAENVHPLYSLKSLAGIALVIPVFIGAFDMLAENIHLASVGFLWINDLARPDAVTALPLNLPFFGDRLNLLPFIMTALSVWASALHQPPVMDAEQHRKQRFKLLMMALVFLVLFYTFPAGMVLYWTTNNLISVIKNFIRRRGSQTP